MARSKLTRDEYKKEAKLLTDLAERFLNNGNIERAAEYIKEASGAIERARRAEH